MSLLDKNTILSLNKNPGSIDLHNLALSRMGNVKIDPSIKHDFLEDRARDKKIGNSDEMYQKLNELERNGILDIWIKKFGKDKYKQQVQESIEITKDILLENGSLKLILDPAKIVEEMGGAVASVASGSTAIATMGGSPKTSINITTKYPCTSTDCNKTHQDPGADTRGGS